MAEARLLSTQESWASGTDEVLSVCIARERKVLLTGHESVLMAWLVGVPEGVARPHATKTAVTAVHDSVTCIRQFPRSSRLAVSCNQTVLLLDYAVTDGHVSSLMQCDQYCFSTDEINALDIHAKETYICTCDDNGEIKIIDLDNKCLLRSLSNFHESICSSVKFIPRRPWEVISGGLDSKIGRWDFRRGKLLAKANTQQDGAMAEMMINPPMVHSLAVIDSQNCIACGLGDGRLAVYSLRAPKGLELMQESKQHSSSIACVGCIEGSQEHVETLKNYVVSVGNDSVLCVHVLESDKHGGSIVLRYLDKLEGITKVNDVDVDCRGDSLTICTADVTGTISMYKYVVA